MSLDLFSGAARRMAVARALDPDLPSGRGFVALLEAFRATGGTAPGEVVARLLEEDRAGPAVSLAHLIYSGQAFGFEWRESLWIPMFQFDAGDLALNEGIQHLRAELPLLWSGWSVAAWFASANAHLQGRRPVDLLPAEATAVMRAARALAPVAESRPAPSAAPRHEEAAALLG